MELHQSLYVSCTDSCIEWKGATNANGYGVVSLNRKLAKILNIPRVQFAHRASYLQNVGPLAEGEVVRHQCHNRSCFNPRHLLKGSQHDNIQDAIRRGTIKQKLTEADVVAIRSSTESQRKVAALYGVSGTTVWKIRNGERWRHSHGKSSV